MNGFSWKVSNGCALQSIIQFKIWHLYSIGPIIIKCSLGHLPVHPRTPSKLLHLCIFPYCVGHDYTITLPLPSPPVSLSQFLSLYCLFSWRENHTLTQFPSKTSNSMRRVDIVFNVVQSLEEPLPVNRSTARQAKQRSGYINVLI